MTAKYTPLATITLTSTDTEIVFANIPNSYKDLILQGQVRSTRAAGTEDMFLQLNGDTASNYSAVFMYGSSGGYSSLTASGGYMIVATNTAAANATSGVYSSIYAQIQDASATDKHKTLLTRNGGGNQDQVWATAGRWASTSAISSIRIYYTLGSIASGTTLSLYGVK